MQAFAIWVTTYCNMNCKYCYEGSDKDNLSISYQILEQTIQFIQNYMALHNEDEVIVDFHGGEPLLQFDKILYAVKKLRKAFGERIHFGITTNGTIMTDDILNLLCAEFDYSLTVSLDGIEQYHNFNRKMQSGEGSYNKAINTATKLLDSRNDIRIRMTVDSQTTNNLCENVWHFVEKGFTTIVPVINYFDSKWDQASLDVFEEQLIMLKKKVLAQNSSGLHIGMIDDYRTNKIGDCLGGINSYHISPIGEIYPCAYVVGNFQYIIGDVVEGLTPENIMFYQSICKEKNEMCDGCGHEEACISSRCKLLNMMVMGDYYLPSPIVCNIENIKKKISEYSLL